MDIDCTNPSDGSWSATKSLRPKLPSHVTIQPRTFHGETWYVLHNALTNQFHRLNQTAYTTLSLMDGTRTLEVIFDLLKKDEASKSIIKRQDILELLQYLYASDLLVGAAQPQTSHIVARQERKRSVKLQQLLKNPAIWRIPLFNPDRVLERLLPVARFLSSPIASFIWLVVVSFALSKVITHWNELASTEIQQIFSPGNLFLLWLIYPLLKIFHELGHALFTKLWSGSVYECGVVIILGTPLPYVDATSATGIPSKRRRVMIGAAGMAVELFIASVSLLLWLNASEGLFKNILFNIMLIGGVSTLLFNANPLMRFDGYYIFSDLLGLPNLAKRAQNQLTYTVKKRLLRINLPAPEAIGGRWSAGLVTYAITALLYRFVVLFSIMLIAITLFPIVGLILSAWLITSQIFWPIVTFVRYLLLSPELHANRKVVLQSIAVIALTFMGILFFLPIPNYRQTQGVIWLTDEALIRSPSNGFLQQQQVSDGDLVKKGDMLFQLSNPELKAELELKKIDLLHAEIRYQNVWLKDRIQVELIAEEIKVIRAEINGLEEEIAALTIRSQTDGIYQNLANHVLNDSYIHQGDSIAIVQTPGTGRVKTVLNQEDIALIRSKSRRIELKTASHPGKTWQGKIYQDIPMGTFQLPSAALGTAGGGKIAVSNQSGDGTQSLEEVFVLDVLPTLPLTQEHLGERVWVRFYFAEQPIAFQIAHKAKVLINRFFQDQGQDFGSKYR